MSATFCLPIRGLAEDGSSCLPRQSYDGHVNVSIVDANCDTVSSVVLTDGNVLSGTAQTYSIDASTGDMCELILATAEDFSTNTPAAGLQYRFDYRYQLTSCNGKITRGSFWVPIQDVGDYTIDAQNCVQIGLNGATTCAGVVLPPGIGVDTRESEVGQLGLLNNTPANSAPYRPALDTGETGTLYGKVIGHYTGSVSVGGDTFFEVITAVGVSVATGSIPEGQNSILFAFTHPMTAGEGIAARVVAPFPTTPATGLILSFEFVVDQ